MTNVLMISGGCRMEDERILVKTKDAAELLSISPRYVSKLAAEGKIPMVKIGSATRYRVIDLHKCAEDNLKGLI